MWREWGRSIDLRDSAEGGRQVVDLGLLVLAQALPLPVLIAIALWGAPGTSGAWLALAGINGLLLALRVGVLRALAGSYDRPGIGFWLSPLADPAAVFRVVLSTVRRPTRWRGRVYG